MTFHITAVGFCIAWVFLGAIVNLVAAFTESQKPYLSRARMAAGILGHLLVAIGLFASGVLAL